MGELSALTDNSRGVSVKGIDYTEIFKIQSITGILSQVWISFVGITVLLNGKCYFNFKDKH